MERPESRAAQQIVQAANVVRQKEQTGPESPSVAVVLSGEASLIDRNSTIPAEQKQVFSTAEANQSAVTVKAHQGERQMATDSRLLASSTWRESRPPHAVCRRSKSHLTSTPSSRSALPETKCAAHFLKHGTLGGRTAVCRDGTISWVVALHRGRA
jgi:hypothetical protein